MMLFREGLLEGRTIAVAGGVRPAVCETLTALGAQVEGLDEPFGEDGAQHCAPERATLDALVYEAAPAFGNGGEDGLRSALELGWAAIRGVAMGALISRGQGGKVMLLAPRADAGPGAEAARSALENMARTLSVEWARYAITTTALAPGLATTDQEVATLVAFLASPAGDYFSGCRLELGAVAPAR